MCINNERQVNEKLGHEAQNSRLPFSDVNGKLDLFNKGLGRDEKRRYFFFSGLRPRLSRLECLHQ